MFFLLSLSGLLSCSYLPRGLQISDQEAGRVRALFEEFLASQSKCRQCLDARVVISLKSTWIKGSMEGYIKVGSPDRLKYIALNPLGQTNAVLVTRGDEFHFLSLPSQKSYQGKASADRSSRDYPYTKYVPADFPFDRSFYLFTGRIFSGPVKIDKVGRAQDGNGYWLEVDAVEGGCLILFDDIKQVVRECIILDREGRESLKLVFDNYRSATGCKLPGLVLISSREQGADIRMRLSDWRQSSCPEEEFHFKTPRSFEDVVYN